MDPSLKVILAKSKKSSVLTFSSTLLETFKLIKNIPRFKKFKTTMEISL